uniref:Calcineurin-like phosphoesterase domain-containing protein n=1 Tax=Chromera velia CCMP2878 TaxID=1169474 RepID=A0A0G4HR09_9ALVE|eukprot:Cvel_8009.t1-p1 / transcript=Cvel_8009.t1 / gene=Cvel_8009 / organism=Chromera_velia_CCMP2878 / gene_product=hypothetical protein / transcript_product=hypothetical protein / location=Cvel_scaffold432:34549-37569(-) / protein_length=521 / sequence_SO=supercontig / SO=protein_coding / is_pseudo=false
MIESLLSHSRLQQKKMALSLSVLTALVVLCLSCVAAAGYEVFGLGDFHGDESFFYQSLLTTGKFTLDKKAEIQWKEGAKEEDFEIVLTGDYVDRGERGLTIIETLMRLQRGWEDKLIPMLGNHEEFILLLSPDRNAGVSADKDDWPLRERTKGALGVGKTAEVVAWLRERPVVFVSKSGVLFAHGGLSPAIADKALARACENRSFDTLEKRQKGAISIINRVANAHYERMFDCGMDYVIQAAGDDGMQEITQLSDKLKKKRMEWVAASDEGDESKEEELEDQIDELEERLQEAAVAWILQRDDLALRTMLARAKMTCPSKPWPLATNGKDHYQSHANGVTWWRGLGRLPKRLKENKSQKFVFRGMDRELEKTCGEVKSVNEKLGLKGQAVGHTTWDWMIDLCFGQGAGPAVSLDVSPKECTKRGKMNDSDEACGFKKDTFDKHLDNHESTSMQTKNFAAQSFHWREGGAPERCLLQPYAQIDWDQIENGARLDDDFEIETSKPVAIECFPLISVQELVEAL